jgi:hypothetical protein
LQRQQSNANKGVLLKSWLKRDYTRRFLIVNDNLNGFVGEKKSRHGNDQFLSTTDNLNGFVGISRNWKSTRKIVLGALKRRAGTSSSGLRMAPRTQ